jgi:hypothetical protein
MNAPNANREGLHHVGLRQSVRATAAICILQSLHFRHPWRSDGAPRSPQDGFMAV